MPSTILGHKIALDLNDRQRSYCRKAAGAARFAYNWALGQVKESQRAREHCIRLTGQYELHYEIPTGANWSKRLNAVKDNQYPWMRDVSATIPLRAIENLGNAFKAFYKKLGKFPRFKKKGVHDSFCIGKTTQIKIKGRKLWMPRLGWVRMFQRLRFAGRIIQAVVSRKAHRWFVAISVELNDLSHLTPRENQGDVGIDLGLTHMATLSNGKKYQSPKPLANAIHRLRRLSKSHSRKQKGSKNRAKSAKRLARMHARIANVRRDFIHKLTTMLTRRFKTLYIEDLAIVNMVKNRSLSRGIADVGWGEFVRQLMYKAEMRGGQVVRRDKWFPSSKICSSCGHKLDKLPLSVREWVCPECGAEHDRDINAAKNLAARHAVTACGEKGISRSEKQETSSQDIKQLALF